MGRSNFLTTTIGSTLLPAIMKITTWEEYKLITKRVNEGKKQIDAVEGWLKPEYKRWVDQYEALAVLLLNWEIENDLLPI